MPTIFVFYLALFTASTIFASSVVETESIQILAINDFHGSLEPPVGSAAQINGDVAGGVEYLATHIKSLREGHAHSVTVSAGDLFGASPFLSAMFKEEPTIKAMNLLGLDFNAVGNHEFDKGWRELLRLQRGQTANVAGDHDFNGADFQFLLANSKMTSTGELLFPAYKIREFGDVKIAFVGVVLEAVDEVVFPDALLGLSFFDEADTVNALVPELKNQGVETIVLLIHEGGHPTGNYNECPGISGPIVDIANRLSDEVGVIISGHTHKAYNCVINNKLVTSAASHGRLVTEIDLLIDTANNKLLRAEANNHVVRRNIDKDPAQTALIEHYKERASPIANEIVGEISESITKTKNNAGESALGQMLTDAQLEVSGNFSAQLSFLNPGGIRSDLIYATSNENEGDGKVSFAESFAVQPFGNQLITMTLTGSDIEDLLEQQFAGCGRGDTTILQISSGLSYTYQESAPACKKVMRDSVRLFGQPLNKTSTYRVTVNNFLAAGGDGFSVFKKGIDRSVGMSDLDALLAYLKKHSPLTSPKDSRITRLP